jgi:hypothetical protein
METPAKQTPTVAPTREIIEYGEERQFHPVAQAHNVALSKVSARGRGRRGLRGRRYCPSLASAVSTRASVGVCPTCENIRRASVRC